MKFSIGDLVVLKSGGPVMTVTKTFSHDNTYHTSWFSGKKHEHGSFPEAALEAAKLQTKP